MACSGRAQAVVDQTKAWQATADSCVAVNIALFAQRLRLHDRLRLGELSLNEGALPVPPDVPAPPHRIRNLAANMPEKNNSMGFDPS